MRLSPLGELNEEQQKLLVRTLGPGAPPPPPFLVWAHKIELADWVEGLGAYCRNESSFPQRLRELSVCIAGLYFDSPFAWSAHYQQAIDLGVPKECLDRLARFEDPQFVADDERVFHRFASELLGSHRVSGETYAAALDMFGEPGLVDLIGTLGSFTMSAMMLNAFEVELMPGWPADPFGKGGRDSAV